MAKQNKTRPTKVKVSDFLKTVSDERQAEAEEIIQIMQGISGQNPVMWGPSIIGFGRSEYKTAAGRAGEVPTLGFSPRKTALTFYILEGFDVYSQDLKRLGKHKTSVVCLYVNKLSDIDLGVLRDILQKSYALSQSNQKNPKQPGNSKSKLQAVSEYIKSVPKNSRPKLEELRKIIKNALPEASEVLSYGIIGYKPDPNKRAAVFIGGWADHVSLYPVPKDPNLQKRLKAYQKSKGTLWFDLDNPLPEKLIVEAAQELAKTV